ncbi:class I SAM-dependent methyltransferase [Mesorhizobium sp.]|uniref:class I SAM-dependent methyltransferase n=1 Tax=Mesorhizobium sp. TaxID=1871066 RepID=UPI00120DAC0E|nr:class I SAM-dependent methyltransferase [Mesorhizobium sp.]TIX86127.1 MAG: class I SAM-dependent methyltransferase [Mesorhizobium sp.]
MTSNGTQVPIKRDWSAISEFCHDVRTPERIFAHYQIEKALAAQLLNSDQDARLSLYAEVYGKLFTSLEDHPQNRNEYRDDRKVNLQTILLRTLVQKGARFGELGAGDCKLSLSMCNHCASVNAIDVTDALLPPGEKPANFQFVKIDGIHLPFADNSLDFMFSDQLMEHLHPDDAVRQLSEVYRVLAPGGAYYCITPSAVTGPHDISVYFDNVACGFHLKEYSYGELSRAFTGVGLRKQAVLFGHGAVNVLVPAKIGIMLEMVMQGVWRRRSRPTTNSVLRHLMGIRLLGYK